MAGMPTRDNFDLELETEEGAGLLPGLRIVPTEILALGNAQVGEFCWSYWSHQEKNQIDKV